MQKRLLAATVALGFSISVQASPTMDEMWKIIQQQQAEIERLKAQQDKTNTQLELTEQKVEATASVIDGDSTVAKVAQWANKTRLGGYGEVHYNKLDDDNGTSDKDEIDIHRFVLFLGHQFTDDVRFFSELEVEHSVAGEGKKGEVELEQAYIEWDYAAEHRAKAGVFLVPVGILNETHEPNTFYGVERNSVEKNIIPSTWWTAGVASTGEFAPGWKYDVAVHSGLYSGLKSSDGDRAKIRNARQKASKAKADDYAYTGRIKYTGIQGLELAATLQYQSDLFQSETLSNTSMSDSASDVSAFLYEFHAIYQRGDFAIRALYAAWDIDDGINVFTDGADEQKGFYIEPSYKISPKLGVFTRYSEWDNAAGGGGDSKYSQIDVGVNYWLAPTVVFKADYQMQDVPGNKKELNGINLGVGWSF